MKLCLYGVWSYHNFITIMEQSELLSRDIFFKQSAAAMPRCRPPLLLYTSHEVAEKNLLHSIFGKLFFCYSLALTKATLLN